ncbi:hypothetical protein [Pontivivens ytuae]|uniref:Uncharacterized protein n=1 Tax=Pontivivens ytuae TaxID=2789856 RepID=A0A7S9LVL4_9RHOB|nr:hypothetical protein [Pontivivens ytuae]QPH55991.1 hypothetical protein I0K15_09790 [Pontivivens ytuae]
MSRPVVTQQRLSQVAPKRAVGLSKQIFTNTSALSDPAPADPDMMRHNATTLARALSS